MTIEGEGKKVVSGVERDGASADGPPEPVAHAEQGLHGPSGEDEWHALQPNRRLQAWTLEEGLLQELNRCRRSGRPFVLMRMTLRRPGQRRRLHWPRRHRVTLPDGYSVRALFRRIDFVWQQKQSFAILLPECDRTKAARVVERVSGALAAKSIETDFDVAVFPEDGLTSGALIKAVARGSEARGGRRRKKEGEASLADALSGRLPGEGVTAPASGGQGRAGT